MNKSLFIFISNKLLTSPLEAMFNLLIFIFAKELHATPLQLTLLVASKPVVGLLSFYGNIFIKSRPGSLKPFVITLNMLGALPALVFPYSPNSWFFIASYALFMLSLRGTVPAWIELLKINLPPKVRAETVSIGSTANCLVTILIPLLVSNWLDIVPGIWKWLFFLFANLQLLNCILVSVMPLKSSISVSDGYHDYQFTSLKELIVRPWENFWKLIKEREDFRCYQIMFFLGGVGLVAMQPALPIFFNNILNLSYTQVTLATHVCRGVFFALSAPLWAKAIQRLSLYRMNFYINVSSVLFILFLMAANYHLAFLYLGYSLYGIIQAGSELCWNLSGAIFSQKQDSTLYTGSNLAVVGMRGCICPFLGQLLLSSSVHTVFVFAECFCLLGLIYSFHLAYQKRIAAI